MNMHCSVSRFGKFVLEAGRHPPMRRHQRGCSQRQYHLALLPHPAFKFPKRHVSWPRFFSSIHFTSEEKLTWPKYTGAWHVFCCSQLRRQRKSTIPKVPSGGLLWSELSPLKWTPT